MERKSKQMTPLTMSILQKYLWFIVGIWSGGIIKQLTQLNILRIWKWCGFIDANQLNSGKKPPENFQQFHQYSTQSMEYIFIASTLYHFVHHSNTTHLDYVLQLFTLNINSTRTSLNGNGHILRFIGASPIEWNSMKQSYFRCAKKNKSAQSLSIAMMCWLIVYMLSQ